MGIYGILIVLTVAVLVISARIVPLNAAMNEFNKNVDREIGEAEKVFSECSGVIKGYYGKEILYCVGKPESFSYVRVANGTVTYVVPRVKDYFFANTKNAYTVEIPDSDGGTKKVKSVVEVNFIQNITKVKETKFHYKIYGTRQFSVIDKPFLEELPGIYQEDTWVLIPKKIGKNSDIFALLQ